MVSSLYCVLTFQLCLVLCQCQCHCHCMCPSFLVPNLPNFFFLRDFYRFTLYWQYTFCKCVQHLLHFVCLHGKFTLLVQCKLRIFQTKEKYKFNKIDWSEGKKRHTVKEMLGESIIRHELCHQKPLISLSTTSY